MKNFLIILIALIIIIIAAVAISNNGSDVANKDNMVNEHASDTMMEKDEMEDDMMNDEMKKEDEMVKDLPSEEPLTAGMYTEYAPEKVSQSGDTVLFFHANWCPSCRSADKAFKAEMEIIPGDLTILKVNFDDSSELRKKYGVTSQHTFVQVDADGNLVKKWTGSPTIDSVVKQLQ